MSLVLEQKVRDESEYLKVSWNSGPFNFLLNRTSEKYPLKLNTLRRLQCEKSLGLVLPKITDEMLLSLYNFSCQRYQQKCRNQYGNSSGFYSTQAESVFAKTLRNIIKNNPKLSHLEVYPSNEYSKDLPKNFKAVIGNYVPDFLIFGIKIKGVSAVVAEINGDSHNYKFIKDELKDQHLKELNIFTWGIDNKQVQDMNYLEKALLEMYRPRNRSLNEQIKRTKRMIWVKTISCQLTLNEVEKYVQREFSTKLNLESEAGVLKMLKDCPRSIKKELRSLFL